MEKFRNGMKRNENYIKSNCRCPALLIAFFSFFKRWAHPIKFVAGSTGFPKSNFTFIIWAEKGFVVDEYQNQTKT